MVDIQVAKRYAKSVLELSKENGVVDAVSDDMKLFIKVCEQNHDLVLMLLNPIIATDKKMNVLNSIFNGKVNKLTISFFEIVTRKGREKYLVQIAKEFVAKYKQLKNIQTAEITSAVGLDDKLRKQVYDIIRNSTNSEVELIEKIDNKLIGGFILRMDDKQYDASISSELRKLTQAFSSNPYVRKN